MNKTDTSSNRSVVMWAFAGLAVGFVTSLLLTPQSGDELRGRFWQLVDDAEEQLDEELDQRGLL